MKLKFKSVFAFALAALLLVSFAACSPIDNNYGVESSKPESAKKDVSVPEIKSTDVIMSNYFDISKYDEENYADIYLGKKFSYKITYSGSELTLPFSFKELEKKGFKLSEGYEENDTVFAGEMSEVVFENEYGNVLNAVFYNSGKSSQKLKKCNIVEFSVPENSLFVKDSKYGQFWINGVSNGSAITDITDYIGAPSHFYSADGNIYCLDFFMGKDDTRSKMSITVEGANDKVISVKVSKF